MPATFVRLRIAGFKSFAEPVSVEILPGLTGIVGPNGCGKSNVVEALRWAMGESSARSLRGGEMDDLIFSGTVARPARNLAEVVLTLEDAAGLLPPPFHDQPELQISRRIERGAGSAYRVNGHELRARDVQTLFADLASGARSSAMVSQGRVAAIVGARPEERRQVLEEAAGITGLHARRHEAELKLRATESNLSRAEDLRIQLEGRVRSLAGQATQAGHYREIASRLRDGETTLLALLHARARQAVTESGTARQAVAAALADAEQQLREAEAAEAAAEHRLPAPRSAETHARAVLQRRRIETEAAARDGERALQDAAQADARLAQAQGDRDAAALRQADALDAEARLDAETTALDKTTAVLPDRLATEAGRLDTMRRQLGNAEQAARATAGQAASAQMQAAEAARDHAAAAARLDRAATVLAQIDAEQAQGRAALPDPERLHALDALCREAAATAVAAEHALEAATEAKAVAARTLDAARIADAEGRRFREAATDALGEADARSGRLTAEHDTLVEQLRTAEAGLVPEAGRAAAADAVAAADVALEAAAAALDAAEAARGRAMSARLEAGSRAQDGHRRRDHAEAARHQAEDAWARATARRDALARETAQALAAILSPEIVAGARHARERAELALADNGTRLTAAEAAQEAAGADAARSAGRLAEARDLHGRLKAEADGLAQLLAPDAAIPDGTMAASWRRLADELEVPPGLETALAACLADGLEAACAPDAPRAWLALPALEADSLPSTAVGLDGLVSAPAELQRVLSHAGLIADDADGPALQAALQPGQCLVTRSGALWRWDGYRVEAGTPSPAAMRLQQRTRLRQLRTRLRDTGMVMTAAAAEAAEDARRQEQAADAARALRTGRAPVEQALARARGEEARIGRQDAEHRARLDALTAQHAQAAGTAADAEAALDAAHAACDACADVAVLAGAHDAATRHEADMEAAEAEARTLRRRTEADAQDAREVAAAGLARHAEHQAAHDMLAPLLVRIQAEADLALAGLAAAREALAACSHDDGAGRLAGCETRAAAAQATEQAARDGRRDALAVLAARNTEREQLAAALLDGRNRLDMLASRHASAQTEHDDAAHVSQAVQAAAAMLPDPVQAAAAASAASERLAALRDDERAGSDAVAALTAEQAALEARRGLLAADVADWRARRALTDASLRQAEARLADAQAEQALRAEEPFEAERRAGMLAKALDTAQADHEAALAALAEADGTLQRTQHDRRRLEAGLAGTREAAVRAEARQDQARAILAQLLADTPDPPATVPDDLSDSAETALRRRIVRLARERDEIGPVNLRADTELHEAEQQAATILREREEIEGAIARLRGQIGHLNREGRDRLMAVFEAVDGHFRSLFARMFNGGRAHLGMVGSDDPLNAGLEIYAQPPGKKLSTLSLLSGGEQALTALSLIFAVFRCNPAPVCVLDEVDAPLDDANVERFCALLEDMVRETGTRFLVVTHHQLTMAHMDRLYGVTMQERGVSRVLSVDLALAADMVG